MNATRTKVTVAAARKALARATAKLEEAVSIRAPGSLGHSVHNLEAGHRHRKERAYRNARDLVEAMGAAWVERVDRFVVRDHEDGGFSSVYVILCPDRDPHILLTVHSSIDRVALSEGQQIALARALDDAQGEK